MDLKTILNLDSHDETNISESYLLIDNEEINSEARSMAEEMSGLIFLDSKIKFINLMEAEGQKTKNIRE